ncbi:MAG: aldo/keto reductase [Vulcanimicrobiaceae bacterium]
MQYTRLGSTGLIVSRLGFGAMTFGSGDGPMGSVWKTDQRAADAIVGHAIDRGVTLFDTADAYASGESEEMLGRALGSHRRRVVLSTKIGFRLGEGMLDAGLSYRRIVDAVAASLRRLNTDWIDLLSLHTVDPFTPLDETLRALEDVVRRGWVRYVGYSNFPAWMAATMVERQRAQGYATMCAAQMYWSLAGRDLEFEHLPFAREAGVGIVVWGPLAGGFLTGRYTRENPTGGGGRLAGFDSIPMDKERAYDLVDRLAAIAATKTCTIAQLALAWLLARPEQPAVLLGASRIEQLDQNLGALDVVLTADEIAALDALTAPALPYPYWYLDKVGGDATLTAALGR